MTFKNSDLAHARQRDEQRPVHMEESLKFTIGIHVMDDGERLLASCAALKANTLMQVEVLLLADGADDSAESAIAQLGEFRRVGFVSRHGAAACFNLLAREGQGDVLVFVESGALPGPGWLESLSLALSQDPSNGLAGPSTNRSWNMQCVFPDADSADITATARTAQNSFANSVSTMEPLYCLADFCYAVKREVVQTIGAADEAYEGPCWEMDYNLRAVRAGWRPVWAKSAYVYRMPCTPQRIQRERDNFEASRNRYQDKFCARQLTGNPGGYNKHCRGEQCSNFAPQGWIALAIPLNEMPRKLAPIDVPHETRQKPDGRSLWPSRPLVSCIMPTRNRRPFIPLALQCFEAQYYDHKELVIVDDGEDSIEDLIGNDPRVKYRRLSGRHSIGAKRNSACELAQGKIVVLWDDDDWYGSNRIAAQVDPILSGDAEITGLDTRWILNLSTKEFWTLAAPLHQRMFVGNIAGGTMAFDRDVWDRGVRFPSVDLAEDAHFLLQAQQTGARLIRVFNDDLFIYMRHGSNSWIFNTGLFLEEQGWLRIESPNKFDISLMDLYVQAAIKKSDAYGI